MIPLKIMWSNLLCSIDYQILCTLNRGEETFIQQYKLKLFINFKTLKHCLKIEMRKLQLSLSTHSLKTRSKHELPVQAESQQKIPK